MEVKIISPLVDKNWDTFIEKHPYSSIFHLSNWAAVLQQTYGYIPYYFVLQENSQKYRSSLPLFLIKNSFLGKRLICLPFADFCRPLITSDDDYGVILCKVYDLIKQEKISNLEIRGGDDMRAFSRFNYYKKFKLDLSLGIDRLWHRFKQKSIRYPISKAKRENVIIEHGQTLRNMKNFYRLNLLTRRKHGVLPQPFNFFKNIFEELISKNYGFLFLAKNNKTVIAASVFFIYKDVVYHKYNASNVRFAYLCPNHLIIWRAIQWAANNGFRYLDLGRTAPDNQGLMQFKRHWGAEEIDLPYYYYPAVKGVSSMRENSLAYRITTAVLRKAPTKALEFLGNNFYRYLA